MRPDTLDTLARLRIRPGSRPAWRRKLDDAGAGVAVTLPHPADLAHTLPILAGHTLYRTGSAGVVAADGTPLAARGLSGALVREWAGLPDRGDAGAVYRDLRNLAQISPERSAPEYALDVVKAWRRTLPKEPAPAKTPKQERPPPKSGAERDREKRARRAREEAESGRWWLDGWLDGWGEDEDAPAPGLEVEARALLALCREGLEEIIERYRDEVEEPRVAPYLLQTPAERRATWQEDAVEEDGLPSRPRLPGARRFYGVATDVLGEPIEKRARTKVYAVPDTRGGGTQH